MKYLVSFFSLTIGLFLFAQSNDESFSFCEKPCKKDITTLDSLNKWVIKNYSSYPDSCMRYCELTISQLEPYLSKRRLPFDKLGFTSKLATCYINFGILKRNTGNIGIADSLTYVGLNLGKEINDYKVQASAWNNLAVSFLSTGRNELAFVYIDSVLAIKEYIPASEELGDAYGNKGYLYFLQGNIKETMRLWKISGEIFEEGGYLVGASAIINNLGFLANQQGNLEDAKRYFEQALAMRRDLGFKKEIANSLNNVAAVYDNLDEVDKAIKFYTESYELSKDISDKEGMLASANNIGYAYESIENYDKALEYYQISQNVAKELNHLEKYVRVTRNLSSLTYDLGKFELSEAYADSCYRIAKSLNFPDLIKKALQMKLDMAIFRNSEKNAFQYATELLQSVEDESFSNFIVLPEENQEKLLKSQNFILDNVYSFVVNTNNGKTNGDLYNAVAKRKGLVLKSSLAMKRGIEKSKDSLLLQEYNSFIQLKKVLISFKGTDDSLKSLNQRVDELEQKLKIASSDFSNFDKVQNFDWKTLQENMTSSEAIIEFVSFQEVQYAFNQPKRYTDSIRYAALILRKNDEFPIVVPLFYEHELEQILSKNRSDISNINDLYSLKNKELRTLIWEPMNSYFKNITSISYSPVGLLHTINFAAIPMNAKKYLIDQYQLNLLSSVIGDFKSDIKMSPNENYGLIGGVDYSNTENPAWEYLQGTKFEVEEIKEILDRKDIKNALLEGEKCTEPLVKSLAENSSVLHISTHGFFIPNSKELQLEVDSISDEDLVFRSYKSAVVTDFYNKENPLDRSGLILSGANKTWQGDSIKSTDADGVLTAHEVSQYNLKENKLVVLSACETARGDIDGSEGVYGLQRAFKMAGSNKLILSLWKVSDNETKEFMTTFYKNLSNNGSIASSFFATQRAMKKKYGPYFWAAFVLVN